mmetsp:Transcript_22672/g.66003  ORF Transcript_22672/g.66003 Transcript_22672/m.66003 type:complete len:238 (-) Transcript_22672:271-984(-)
MEFELGMKTVLDVRNSESDFPLSLSMKDTLDFASRGVACLMTLAHSSGERKEVTERTNGWSARVRRTTGPGSSMTWRSKPIRTPGQMNCPPSNTRSISGVSARLEMSWRDRCERSSARKRAHGWPSQTGAVWERLHVPQEPPQWMCMYPGFAVHSPAFAQPWHRESAFLHRWKNPPASCQGSSARGIGMAASRVCRNDVQEPVGRSTSRGSGDGRPSWKTMAGRVAWSAKAAPRQST